MGVGDVDEASSSASRGRRYFTGPVEEPDRYWVDPGDLARPQHGGEGVVYRAHSTRTGELVALKLLTTLRPDEVEQLRRRSRSLEDLAHPSLMHHIEVFHGSALYSERDGQPCASDFDVAFAVAGWVDGRSLVDVVDGATTMAKLDWIADLADAVATLHAVRTDDAPNGIVHRDVKPSNVRIRSNGTAVLLDFGVARPMVEGDMTIGVGTHLWRPPEVLAGRSAGSRAGDVWSVGALAHWLLVGEPPYLDGRVQARRRIDLAVADLGDPTAAARHLSLLLASTPEDRPGDLAAWASTLRRLVARRRRRRISTAAAAALVASAVVIVTMPTVVRADPGGGAKPRTTVARRPSADSVGAPRTESTTITATTAVGAQAAVAPAPTVPVTAFPPYVVDWSCPALETSILDLRSGLRALLLIFTADHPAAEVFQPGWSYFGLLPQLESVKAAVAAWDEGRLLAARVGVIDNALIEAFLVEWIASAEVGGNPSGETMNTARFIAARLVGRDAAPSMGRRLQALNDILVASPLLGCDDVVVRSPHVQSPIVGQFLRAPVTDRQQFYDRVDDMRGRLYWPTSRLVSGGS